MTTSDIAVQPDMTPQTLATGSQVIEMTDMTLRLAEWAQAAEATYAVAERLCQSSFVPVAFKGKPIEASAAMLAGMELGFSPMASLRAFDVIQGTAAPRAITIRAVVLSLGHEIREIQWDDTTCILEGRRKGTETWQRVEWTVARAERDGLPKKNPNWNTKPKNMVRARADSELGRLIAADALLGIPYSAEEIQDMDPVQATVVSSSTSPHGQTLRDLAEARRAPVQAAAKPEPITADQKQWLGDAFDSSGIATKDRPAYIAKVIGRTPTTPGDLTSLEADSVLSTLETAAGLAQAGQQ